MLNNAITNEFFILNSEDLIESGDMPLAASNESLGALLESKGLFNRHLGRPVICAGKSLNFSNVKERIALICSCNIEDDVLVIGLAEVEGEYILKTFQLGNGVTILGGESGIMNHYDHNAELKNAFKHLVGYSNRLDLTTGQVLNDGDSKINIEAKNSSIKFNGRLQSSTDLIDTYIVSMNGGTGTLVHRKDENMLNLNLF